MIYLAPFGCADPIPHRLYQHSRCPVAGPSPLMLPVIGRLFCWMGLRQADQVHFQVGSTQQVEP